MVGAKEILDLLKGEVLDPAVLAAHCPLKPVTLRMKPDSKDLSILEDLPAELQDLVTSHMNLDSVLKFRRVNRKALALVERNLDWQKVMMVSIIRIESPG